MKLKDIILAAAERMQNVSVHVVSNYGTVSITDDDNIQDEIFLQGDDASAFISQRELLWNETWDLTRGDIELYLAEPYVENFWN